MFDYTSAWSMACAQAVAKSTAPFGASIIAAVSGFIVEASYGRDIKKAISMELRYHAEDRVLFCGSKTIVFRQTRNWQQ